MFACEEPDWSSSVILNFYATIKISTDRRLSDGAVGIAPHGPSTPPYVRISHTAVEQDYVCLTILVKSHGVMKP